MLQWPTYGKFAGNLLQWFMATRDIRTLRLWWLVIKCSHFVNLYDRKMLQSENRIDLGNISNNWQY